MESTSLFSSQCHPSLPLSSRKSHSHKQRPGIRIHQLPSSSSAEIKRSTRIAYSSRNGDSYEKSNNKHREMLVDESMIVLRKRIHEMKMIERNYEPPAEWMNWEKQYYTSYDDFICKFVGVLQFNLMNTRPSFALAMLLLISISVPVSTVTIWFHLLDAANGLLSAVHLG
ncbi:hypothetical protein M5689_007175 [Euphorbia peplus]|nr:hypothetical protein M5689_007175 [Euphorbia peplus]